MTVGSALAVQSGLRTSSILRDLPASTPRDSPPPLDVRVLRHYNPEVVSAYNIVPGLLGVILTMTMVLMTGLAMTRERERGTFENLLSTPATPFEAHDREDRALHRNWSRAGHAHPAVRAICV
jgi:ABC-2 type transport system permease protein